jgi:hypothetical protein
VRVVAESVVAAGTGEATLGAASVEVQSAKTVRMVKARAPKVSEVRVMIVLRYA